MFRVLFKRPKTDMLKRRPCRLCRLSVIFFYCLYINFVVKFFAVAIWLWSAICFKITTRYTCCFFPHIFAIIPATRYTCVFCHVYLRFIPKYMTIFLQTRIYMRTKKPIYMRYKQACGICGRRKSSYKRHRIIPSAINPFMYDGAEK